MIKTLLSVRLRSFFSSLSGKKKSENKASVGRIILFAFLYLYVIAVFLGLFTLMAISMGVLMIPAGLDWLYFAIFISIAFALIFIFSIFETKSELFECKDNELLLSMPISPRHIVLSRIFAVLVYNYAEEALVMLPCIICYAVFGGGVLGIVGLCIVFLLLPLLATSLSSGVGYLVALIAKKVKRNSFVTVIISLAFLLLYFWGYGALTGATMGGDGSENIDIVALSESLSGMKFIGSIALCDPVFTPLFVAVSIGVSYLAYRIISHSYISIVTDNSTGKRARYKQKRLRSGGALLSVARKDLSHFFSSSTYMLNGAMGMIFSLIIAVMVLINKNDIFVAVSSLLGELPHVDVPASFALIMSVAVIFCISTVIISAVSLSLEGKRFWIMKSMPVSGKTVLLGKSLAQIVITAPITLVSSLILAVAIGADFVSTLLLIISPLAAVVLSAFVGTAINTAFPKLEFDNEAQPIKQSLSTILYMVSLAVYSMIILGISMLLVFFGFAVFGAVVLFVLNVALSVAFYFIISGPCARKYERMDA